MKIAQIVSTFFPHFGGMGEVCEEEADGLVDIGHDVTVFTLRYRQFDYLSNFFLFNVNRIFPWVQLGDAGLVPQLTTALRDFDIVHFHYPFYGGAEWVWLAKKIFGKKYVVTFHMVASPSGFMKRMVQKIYDTLWQKRILLNAEKILVVDKHYWAQLPFAGDIPKDKVIEFPNGINLKVFRPLETDFQELGLNGWEDKKIILFVGNLLPLKRLDLLLRVLAKINNDDWRLAVVGGGYSEDEYKKLAIKLGLKDKVKFLGYCMDREKLAQFYNVAWTTVLPTDNESFSLVAIESLACGTPVILAANSGGAERIKAGESGWLFTSGSEDELGGAIVSALNFSLIKDNDYKKKLRQSVMCYDWKSHIERLNDIYESI